MGRHPSSFPSSTSSPSTTTTTTTTQSATTATGTTYRNYRNNRNTVSNSSNRSNSNTVSSTTDNTTKVNSSTTKKTNKLALESGDLNSPAHPAATASKERVMTRPLLPRLVFFQQSSIPLSQTHPPSATMTPPSASANGKSTDRTRSIAPAVVVPASNSSKRKLMSSDVSSSSPSPPRKVARATVFSDDREEWLVGRLTGADVYEPLQWSKNNPCPSNAKRKTKAQVHRDLADEYNKNEERRGGHFVIAEKTIKNKIGSIQSAFAIAHKLRYSSGFGSTPETDWREAVKGCYKYYFELEPTWGFVWSDGVSMPAESLSNLDDLIVTDGPARTSVTPYTDGRDNYASGDEGWEDTREAVGDDASDGVVEDYLPHADDDGDDFEEEEERLVRNTRRRQPSVGRTPAAALVSRRQAALADLNPDLEKRPRSGGKSKKEQPQKDLRSTLTDLEGLGRYEIDAKKAVELRQLELSQQKEMAQIECSKANRDQCREGGEVGGRAGSVGTRQDGDSATVSNSRTFPPCAASRRIASCQISVILIVGPYQKKNPVPLTPQVPAFLDARPRQKNPGPFFLQELTQ